MSGTSLCDNPRCNCDPCACDDCRCNTVRLGRLEQQVMEVLWAAPDQELTGRAVANELPTYAYTTVSTVLDRLSNKGLIRRRLEERTRRYAPIGTQADHTATLMNEALETTTEPEDALTAFLASMTAPQRAALRRALGTKPPGD